MTTSNLFTFSLLSSNKKQKISQLGAKCDVKNVLFVNADIVADNRLNCNYEGKKARIFLRREPDYRFPGFGL
jgi:hypothetical protein